MFYKNNSGAMFSRQAAGADGVGGLLHAGRYPAAGGCCDSALLTNTPPAAVVSLIRIQESRQEGGSWMQ